MLPQCIGNFIRLKFNVFDNDWPRFDNNFITFIQWRITDRGRNHLNKTDNRNFTHSDGCRNQPHRGQLFSKLRGFTSNHHMFVSGNDWVFKDTNVSDNDFSESIRNALIKYVTMHRHHVLLFLSFKNLANIKYNFRFLSVLEIPLPPLL